MLVILDSSMLMLPLERNINITLEMERVLAVSFDLVVPKIVIKELEKLCENSSPAIQRKARLALELARTFKEMPSYKEEKTDDVIILLAEQNNAIVATNDVLLRKRLLRKGISVISLYGKNKLQLFGEKTF